jgi:ParB family chromosome partitioning protein
MDIKKISEGRGEYYKFKPEDLTIIGIDPVDGVIHKSRKEHPLWDPRIFLPLDPERVENVQALGVIETIEVRRNGDYFEVVNGRQRVRLAREANKINRSQGLPEITVKVIVVSGDERKIVGIQRATNTVRTEESVLDKAEAAGYMHNSLDMTVQEIATYCGVTAVTVRNWLIVDSLHPEVKAAVASGKIAAHAALKFANVRSEDQPAVLRDILEPKPAPLILEGVQGVKMSNAGEVIAALEASESPSEPPTNHRANGASDEVEGAMPEAPKRPTARQVNQRIAAHTGEAQIAPPSVRELKKILKLNETGVVRDLDPQAAFVMSVLTGELPLDKIKGLKEALEYVRNPPQHTPTA